MVTYTHQNYKIQFNCNNKDQKAIDSLKDLTGIDRPSEIVRLSLQYTEKNLGHAFEHKQQSSRKEDTIKK